MLSMKTTRMNVLESLHIVKNVIVAGNKTALEKVSNPTRQSV